jgi:hypothetical protein
MAIASRSPPVAQKVPGALFIVAVYPLTLAVALGLDRHSRSRGSSIPSLGSAA